MSFKSYLKLFEMPYMVNQIASPDGHRVEPYDMGIEDVNIVGPQERRDFEVRYYKGIGSIPIYCNRTNSIFMYNFETQHSHKPSFGDRRSVEMLLNGMYRHALGRGGTPQLATKLKGIRLPFKPASKVWNTTNLRGLDGRQVGETSNG
jgi:hypothetical protein